ncbi:phage tail assembly chaperone [Pseudomonas azotoformans]
MAIFYCAETGGFYLSGMQPEGLACVEITKAEHADLRAQNAAGKIISAGADGAPIAIVPPPPTDEEKASKERGWRDIEVSRAAVLRDRHRDQLEIGADTALTSDQFTELLMYMQALRDWPQSSHFPDAEHRPVAPAWITGKTE